MMYNCRNKAVLVPGSSAVEQLTVNQLAGGSNPSRGAKPSFYMLSFISFNAQKSHVFWEFMGIKVMDLSITVL